eukprot:TRINITY_DN3519_c0_g1_i1.p1 TRINITY_DN3519_c0_g1~~TRINITY_DN3519_c0_g1_i1.p1  ORF type:complete len:79 (-),score=3.13 TRINITY_DN3519_c0_g1_i1:242-478(-)
MQNTKFYRTFFVDSTTRLIQNRHGVKIRFIQTRQIGRGDFQTSLVQLVSALGLISVATLVVEYMMLYILPFSKVLQEI